MMIFKEMKLSEPLLRAIKDAGYERPTPIQEQAIPPVLAGRDILGCAQTGTGKTAAFSLPIIEQLIKKSGPSKGLRALILTPTRELAIQIAENIETYSRYCNIRHTVIFGGVSQHAQVQKLRAGVDILVATPGRLLDLHGQGLLRLNHLEHFVLDEADRMLDMGFIHDVKRVIQLIPSQRQTLFFSATMPPEIQKLSKMLLVNPVKIEVTPPSSTVERIQQQLRFVDKSDKTKALIESLYQHNTASLVFTRTKHGANKVVKKLEQAGFKAAAIHGNKSQTARQNALQGFKDGSVQVLVATDIAARGIDIDDLSLVYNLDIPDVPETYVHRIGRTGRAGKGGLAITFCSEDEVSSLKDVHKLIGFEIPLVVEEGDVKITLPGTTQKQHSNPKAGNNTGKNDKSIKNGPIGHTQKKSGGHWRKKRFAAKPA